MSKSNFRLALALPILLISVMGCASTRTHESPGEYVDDSAITLKVKTAILGDEALTSSEINV
jgi:osmotically-inducible protein OsmY